MTTLSAYRVNKGFSTADKAGLPTGNVAKDAAQKEFNKLFCKIKNSFHIYRLGEKMKKKEENSGIF